MSAGKISLWVVIMLLQFLPAMAFAEGYVPLSPIPGLSEGTAAGAGDGDIAGYLRKLYSFGVAAAAGLAVIMVILGGIQYITSVSGEGKGGGKQRITSAILGLLLALGSFIILKTINKDLLQLDFEFKPDKLKGTPTVPPYYENVKIPLGNDLISVPEGLSIRPGRVSIDTDGLSPPPFYDPDYKSHTSLPGLDATRDYYVVVPIGSEIPLNTKVTIVDHTSGRTLQAIVGDRGATVNGYGELSLAAARQLGVWTPGQGNSALPHDLTYIFHK